MNNQLIEVSFHNQSVQATMQNGVVFVAMRPIVENIGLDWASQTVKLKKQKDKLGCCDITTPSAGGAQKMLCIPLRKLNGWLFSVNPEKVHADIRDNLIAYQEECFTTLHDYFTKGEAVNPRKTRRNQRQPERPKAPDYRYNITLCYRDNVTGMEERFSGVCNTPEEIVRGTAKRFGMYISEMLTMPFNAY